MTTCPNCTRLQVEELAAKFQSEFLGDPGALRCRKIDRPAGEELVRDTAHIERQYADKLLRRRQCGAGVTRTAT